MKIADILRHKASTAGADMPVVPVVTIGPTGTISEVASVLAEHNIGALLVVDDGNLQGVVSERDIVRHLATSGAAILDRPVADVMTRDVVTCSTRDSVDSIAETMTAKRIRHMPVLDGGELIGMVSIGDVVLSRIRQLEKDRGQLEHYIAG